MRSLLLSVALMAASLAAARGQNTGTSGGAPQLPVGQTFKQFEFPVYQDGKLKATLTAAEATGITLNRAETTDLRIEVYDSDATASVATSTVTTIVTSPKADLYVAEEKMRTKNTVQIDRADMHATSQECDFDLRTKKYVLRDHVRVVLKHLDVGGGGNPDSAHPAAKAAAAPAVADPPRLVPMFGPLTNSILESPGSAAAPGPGSSQ